MPHQTTIRTNTPLSTPSTQQRIHQQTPVRGKPISKLPISPAQISSRKLIQKSVKRLNDAQHNLFSGLVQRQPLMLSHCPPLIPIHLKQNKACKPLN